MIYTMLFSCMWHIQMIIIFGYIEDHMDHVWIGRIEYIRPSILLHPFVVPILWLPTMLSLFVEATLECHVGDHKVGPWVNVSSLNVCLGAIPSLIAFTHLRAFTYMYPRVDAQMCFVCLHLYRMHIKSYTNMYYTDLYRHMFASVCILSLQIWSIFTHMFAHISYIEFT